jgi:hypothetical protein
MKYFIIYLALVLSSSLFAESVHILCDKIGSVMYVNGVEKTKIQAHKTSIELPQGKHELKIIHHIDEAWQGVEIQNPHIQKSQTTLAFKTFSMEAIEKSTKTKGERFSKKGNIVHDKQFNRDWQDDAQLSTRQKSWKEAMEYCQNLVLGGHKDWRLPDDDSIVSVLEHGKQGSVLSSVFEYLSEGDYWSSNIDDTQKDKAYQVFLEEGCSDIYPKTQKARVFCIRGD